MSFEEMLARSPTTSPPLSTVVVVRGLPFHCTTDELLNVLPFTVSVKPDPPAGALLGLNELITGKGALTVKPNALELCPLISVTCTLQLAPSVPNVGFRLICPAPTNV